MTILIAAVVVTLSHAPAADDAEKRVADEVAKFQGKWRVVKVEPPGRKLPEDFRVVFEGGRVKFGDLPACKFKLDPAKDPPWFDQDISPAFNGKDEGVYAPGIYKLDGDKLVLAIVTGGTGDMFHPRPKNLTDKFHGQIIHLERVKK